MARLGPGALVWCGYEGEQPDTLYLDGVRAGHIGGVIVFAENARARGPLLDALAHIRAAALSAGLPPPPVAIDEEGGSVTRLGYRTPFPSAMALAATGDVALVAEVAGRVARTLRADGITVNLSPVCDVNSEALNPVIGTRSFGDDPNRVGALVSAWVRGSQDAGVAAVAKHFPGHGAAQHDSHHTSVDVRANRATLDARELVPFRAAFGAGVAGAMSAHVLYPALDTDDIATLSQAVATTLLRAELGFDGLLMTDAIEMSGLTLAGTAQATVPRAIAAGCDVLLVERDRDARENAWEWISVGVRTARLAAALARVERFRARYGSAPEGEADDEAWTSLAQEAARRSITVVGTPLPRLGDAVRVAAFPRDEGDADRLHHALSRSLGGRLRFAVDEVPEGDGPLVVCTWSARLERDRIARIVPVLEGALVHCALGSPYDAGIAGPRATLLSYGDVPVSLDAIASALAGDLVPSGEPPVSLALPFC